MFRIETVDGTVLVSMNDEQDAILEARQRLEDDPELGEIYIAIEDRYLWKATHAPDWNWNSIVVVVPFDVKVPLMGQGLGFDQHTDFLDAYAGNSAKSARMLQDRGML